MKPKTLALALFAVLSFAGPFVERLATGRVEMLSAYGLAETALSLALLFWWYHVDKLEHGYQAGRLMNAGVLVAAVLALPIYLVRTRGWKRGGIAVALGAGFRALLFALEEIGELAGAWLRS